MEDPYGSPAKTTKAEIGAFLKSMIGPDAPFKRMACDIKTIKVAMDELQSAFFATITAYPADDGAEPLVMEVMETLVWSEEGKLLGQKAYWHPSVLGMAEATSKTAAVEAAARCAFCKACWLAPFSSLR
jgi:hypothetical protein